MDTVNGRLAHYKDMEINEQAWTNKHIHEVTCPSDRKSILVRPAMRSEKIGVPQWEEGPMLNGHTEEVLGEYGYTGEQIEEMKKKKAAVQLDVSGCPHLDQSSALPDGVIGFSDDGQS